MTAIAGIGHNSVIVELSEKIIEIRDRMKVATRTGSSRARWEILLSDMKSTDKFIALVMTCFADEGEDIAPTLDTLELLTGYKKRAILRGIQQAKKADVIEQKALGRRGAPAVYAFKIPDRTLTELAERMYPDTPARPIGCIPMPDRVHGDDTGCMEVHSRVHTQAPNPSRIYKDPQKRKNEEDDPPANSPSEDPVYVNGVGIIGPGFTLDYKTIEVCSALCAIPIEKGNLIAELAARRWAASSFVPGSANAALRRVMGKEKIYLQVDQAKLERELQALKAEQAQVAPVARGSPGTVPDWAVRKDKEAAKKQKLDEDLKRVAERLANEKKTT